ncbi:MAG: DNA replication and repair protein RecF, partial [Polyangiaceae bacterium]|nr:DNA replication and repair protein RecF [Polyangiaceae bacterium]
GADRRKLLDRLALYLSPTSLKDAGAYRHAMRARQRALDVRGERAPDLDAWEALVASHGIALTSARADAASKLIPLATEAFGWIGPPGGRIGVRYAPSAPQEWDAKAFAERLAADRVRDRARGSASVGPHRDDLAIELDSMPARGIASQGQHRAIVLALQLAEISAIGSARGVAPILLLDDVSSELDRDRTAALIDAVHEDRGQVLLTTTRPELIEPRRASAERRYFRVVGGKIMRT